MKYAILGTGMVGRAHAARLIELGHQVTVGTQDVAQTNASTKGDALGNQPFSQWHKHHPAVKLATFADAAAQGELIINALAGHIALAVLTVLKQGIGQKILIDISNPLDFSQGMPPTLSASNTTSLGEQIQAALPQAKVVKAFNTVTAAVQVNPIVLAAADHDIFTSGNDAAAKAAVMDLQRSYGWKRITDLGDITTARGAEMFLPLWLRLFAVLGNPMFNVKIVQSSLKPL